MKCSGVRSPALSNSGPYSPHSGPMLGGWLGDPMIVIIIKTKTMAVMLIPIIRLMILLRIIISIRIAVIEF